MYKKIKQGKDGYRFSSDSILLSEFIETKKNDTLLEIGTGCGIVSILICRKSKIKTIYAVEIQKRLFDFAKKNIIRNSLQDKIILINKDIKKVSFELVPKVDIVFSNPPYYPCASGRNSPNKEKNIAKHEVSLNLKELVKIAYKFLHNKGSFYVIYPSFRQEEVIYEMKKNKIEFKRKEKIHTKNRFVLIEGVKII